MKIQPIIFNWRGQYEKTRSTEKALKKYDPIVINSDEEHERKKWINLGEDAWYTASFIKALEVFDGDVLLQIQGDATYEDWDGLIGDAVSHYNTLQWGVYAPDATWTEWNPHRTNITGISPGIPGLNYVACTDCIVWFIHKDIIKQFQKLKLDMSDQKLGFALDMILCGISHRMRRPVLRNYHHQVHHPQSKGYHVSQAHNEMTSMFGKLDTPMKAIVAGIYRNPLALRGFYTGVDSNKTL